MIKEGLSLYNIKKFDVTIFILIFDLKNQRRLPRQKTAAFYKIVKNIYKALKIIVTREYTFVHTWHC